VFADGTGRLLRSLVFCQNGFDAHPLRFLTGQAGFRYSPLPSSRHVAVLPLSPNSTSGDESNAEAHLPNAMAHFRLPLLFVLWVSSAFAWCMGALFSPTLEIHVMPNTPLDSTYRRSLILTLVDLYRKRSFFSCAVLTFFSVLVPPAKLLCTSFLAVQLCRMSASEVYSSYRSLILCLSYIASYQLLDLYVGVLFVVHFNSDSSDAKFLSGFYWFHAYCMLSLLMSVTLDGAFAAVLGTSASAFALATPPRRYSGALTPSGGGKVQYKDDDDGRCSNRGDLMAGAPRFVDATTSWLLSATFVLLLCYSFPDPVLEVHTIWEGVSIDRSFHPLIKIFDSFLPAHSTPVVACTLFAMNLVTPLLYIIALFGISTFPCSSHDQLVAGDRGSIPRVCYFLVDVLRPWATTDVFCFASLVFVFTVQDGRTLTIPVQGSCGYYAFLGAGFALFALRWLVERSDDQARGRANHLWSVITPRWLALVAAWSLACVLAGGGLATFESALDALRGHGRGGDAAAGIRHYEFEGFSAVCERAVPVVNTTLRRALPATFGDCSDLSTEPPLPCSGKAPLYQTKDGDNYVHAVWLSGINTLNLTFCHLWKEAPHQGGTRYHLTFGGRFDKIQMFLRARECGKFPMLGCTAVNSSRHCCGDNIGFNITFGLQCRPSRRHEEAFKNVTLESCEIEDPMLVDTNFQMLGGNLDLRVLDIGPRIQGLLRNAIARFIRSVEFTWAGERLGVPQLINQLVAYNSPANAGAC